MNRPLNNSVFLLLAALSTALPGPLQGQHTVTLRNGDRLSGTLKRIDGPTWVFAYGGEDVRLPVAEVTGLASSAPIGVRLDDGTIAVPKRDRVLGVERRRRRDRQGRK